MRHTGSEINGVRLHLLCGLQGACNLMKVIDRMGPRPHNPHESALERAGFTIGNEVQIPIGRFIFKPYPAPVE
jgi:hypothetical protein